MGRYIKILSIILAGLVFLIPFLILAYLEHHALMPEENLSMIMLYLLFSLNIVTGFSLFLFYIKTSMKLSETTTIYQDTLVAKDKKINALEKEKIIEQEKRQQEKNQDIDIENQIKNTIPPRADDNIETYSQKMLEHIAKQYAIVQGLCYVKNKQNGLFELKGTYAYFSETEPPPFKTGEGLSGQVAKDQKTLRISDVPDDYMQVFSGLGKSTPNHLIIIPLLDNDETIGILELATFEEYSEDVISFLVQFTQIISQEIKNLLMKQE
jgi:putative methionine-R-sulfoxide reductase with GAF domain